MSADDPGLIDVRPDEQLPLDRLEPYLRKQLPDAAGALRLRQFSGGNANLTYLVSFGDADYVLRRPPLGPLPKGAHDMGREHRILSHLADAFPLAPRSYLYCDDPAMIGAPFLVMERRQGIVIQADMPEGFRGDPALNRRVGEMLIDTLAAFHAVEPDRVGLSDLGRPEGYTERQLAGWMRRWRNAEGESYDGEKAIVDWLVARQPPNSSVTLVHNDYKLNNLIVDATDPACPVALIDWDMCTRGHPLFDLGYLLNYWLQHDDPVEWRQAASMPTWQPGFPSRADAITRYAAATGVDPDQIQWYYVFGIFKLMGILQQIYIRYQRGQTQDTRFATFGARIEGLIEKALTVVD